MTVNVSGRAIPEGDRAVAAYLVDLLGDLVGWRLDRDRWQRVERVIGEVTAALAASDLGALRAATTELALASPTRVHRIGTTAVVEAPGAVRESADRVIGSLRAVGVTASPGPD